MKVIYLAALAAVLIVGSNVARSDNTLEWDPSDGAEGYNVYAKNEACSQSNLAYGTAPLDSVGPVATYVHPLTSSGFNWCYKVTAFNTNGESGFSNEAGKVPAAPGILRVR